ncbi:MAG: TonB-dependent receptor [Bacteroidales bacterium]|nr:TonB-dependent receptor [Bacteroidales bacterium]
MMNRRLSTTIFLAFFSATLFAQGIRDSVFRVPPVTVSTAAIFEKEEAGMKESVVDSVIILEKINLSLSDLLSENTPVFIKDHGRGALATASFRGTAPSHTQVSWNGININSPMAGMVDFSLIPVYIIDELKIRHGTASIADRSGGLGGSINISNRANWSNRLSGKYMQGFGSYSSFDEFLQLNAGNSDIQSKTRLYYNYSKNDYTFINRGIGNIDPQTGQIVNPVDTNNNAAYRKYGLLQEVYLRPGSRDFLSVKYWGQQALRTIPRVTSYEGPDNSNLNSQSDTDHRLLADWQHFGESSKLELRMGYTYKELNYTLKNIVHGIGLLPVIQSLSKQSAFMNKASYTMETDNKFSFKASLDANIYNVNTRDSVNNSGYRGQRSEFSMFFALQKEFGGMLNLNMMLRRDVIDKNLSPFIPYFGFDLRLLQKHELILKGNIAGNYHHPSLNDLYWEPGGNPDLLPEKGYSYELGLEYQAVITGHQIRAELTAYRSDIANWIIWIPSYKGYWEPFNIKRVLSTGLEINASSAGKIGIIAYNISGSYACTSSLNYDKSRTWGDESYGKQLAYVPLHSGNLMIKLSYRGFSLGWQHNSYSERYTTSSNDISRRDRLYPYFMNNLSAGKDLKIRDIVLSGELKIYNLFDEDYRSVLYRPMPGRNYMLILMIKF